MDQQQEEAEMTDDRKRNTGGEVELLPCPWCGEAQLEVRVSEGSTFRWRKVDGCCTDGPEVRHDTMADDQAAAEADSHRRAIEAWNTRANVDRALAESRAEVAEYAASARMLAVERAEFRIRAERLAEALRVAHRHIDMGALWISHSKDAEQIDAALNLEPTP